MTYRTGVAFRRALEDRLARESTATGVPLTRLRKLVAFERLLARLVQADPDGWLLKGGLLLQLRLGIFARATKDIDILLLASPDGATEALVRAGTLDLGDWFSFAIRRDSAVLPGFELGGRRFFVTASVGGRTFESFHIDVGSGDPVIEPPEYLTMSPLLAFADIPPVTIPCYPLTQHLAEKVHAYVLPRETGESSRVKDLVDIVLIADHFSIDARKLEAAIKATFGARSDPAPMRLPEPPPAWSAPYRNLAAQVVLQQKTLFEGYLAAQRFLDPILCGEAQGSWSPEAQAWS
jgi:hypothetical protein